MWLIRFGLLLSFYCFALILRCVRYEIRFFLLAKTEHTKNANWKIAVIVWWFFSSRIERCLHLSVCRTNLHKIARFHHVEFESLRSTSWHEWSCDGTSRRHSVCPRSIFLFHSFRVLYFYWLDQWPGLDNLQMIRRYSFNSPNLTKSLPVVLHEINYSKVTDMTD